MDQLQENSPKDQINSVFNRLRARLFNMVESSVSNNSATCDAMKKCIRDYTSQAWNDLSKLFNEE